MITDCQNNIRSEVKKTFDAFIYFGVTSSDKGGSSKEIKRRSAIAKETMTRQLSKCFAGGDCWECPELTKDLSNPFWNNTELRRDCCHSAGKKKNGIERDTLWRGQSGATVQEGGHLQDT